jgi:hypothetical protein
MIHNLTKSFRSHLFSEEHEEERRAFHELDRKEKTREE